MNPIDYILVAVILAIFAFAGWCIYKSKKSGKKCIGCPGGCSAQSCSSCSGNCSGCSTKQK